jgi:hypothetical protein
MEEIRHATFDGAEDGIRAVESLLHHGARAQDINLILLRWTGLQLDRSQVVGTETQGSPSQL